MSSSSRQGMPFRSSSSSEASWLQFRAPGHTGDEMPENDGFLLLTTKGSHEGGVDDVRQVRTLTRLKEVMTITEERSLVRRAIQKNIEIEQRKGEPDPYWKLAVKMLKDPGFGVLINREFHNWVIALYQNETQSQAPAGEFLEEVNNWLKEAISELLIKDHKISESERDDIQVA